MNRRSAFLELLVVLDSMLLGAFALKARAQAPAGTGTVTSDMSKQFSREPSVRAVPDQCPVCHTPHSPYIREEYLDPDRKKVDGSCYTGSVNDGTIEEVPCTVDDLPDARLVRCKQCNVAFFQDALPARQRV